MKKLEKINKISAAFRQLKTSIELYVSGGDAVSAYTLVRASEEILDKLCEHRNLPRSVMHEGIQELTISDERKKYIKTKLNEPKNYFKHADWDHEKEIEWGNGVIEHFISDCISMYKRLESDKELPCELISFSVLHRARNRDMYDTASSEIFEMSLNEISDLIEQQGLLSVYKSLNEVCKHNEDIGKKFISVAG